MDLSAAKHVQSPLYSFSLLVPFTLHWQLQEKQVAITCFAIIEPEIKQSKCSVKIQVFFPPPLDT